MSSHTWSDYTNSVVICVSVVACNHLMLSLREAAGYPTSLEPLSYSLSQPTADLILIPRVFGGTHSCDDLSQEVPLPKHGVLNHARDNLGRKLGTWHEMQPSSGSAVRGSPEMD